MDPEKKYLVLTLAGSAITGLIAFILGYAVYVSPLSAPLQAPGSNYIESYKAVIRPYTFSGLLLDEEYIYIIRDEGKHFLYRSWDSPLTEAGECGIVPLEIECPPGFHWYALLRDGSLITDLPKNSSDYPDMARMLREAEASNEAGCYASKGIKPGTYLVHYKFLLRAPGKCDTSSCLYDVSLASPGRHLFY